MLRPRTDVEHIADAFSRVLRRCDEEGVTMILLSAKNLEWTAPMGSPFNGAEILSDAVLRRIEERPDGPHSTGRIVSSPVAPTGRTTGRT